MSKDGLPTINFKGSEYVLVKDRILFFNENFKNGSIRNEYFREDDGRRVVVKATVIPDVSNMDRIFVAHSQAVEGSSYINKTSALENAETSAVGRALAMMGIGIVDSVASADEMVKAGATDPDWIRGEEKTNEVREPVNPVTSQPILTVDMCPIHSVKMFPKEGKYGTFYSHLDREQGYCTGKGYKNRS